MADAASTGNVYFVRASEEVKTLSYTPSNENMLELYGLFKQGILGDNETDAPGVFSLTAKAKWNAWKEKAGMSQVEAQAQYIALVEKLKAAQ
ncbi:acyl-CoA-binding protein [Streptomyces sp. XD-27]|uniref:acyl-CoA-binding protein n=1 Tax=Streptomyces sp. XD-27 TaxID=3062779 RepID=UPI0026F46CF0|nr:acyl-CoA-binding protein [Streptomyces sp. XD-27]WKX71285.1 acyl-CoA-binding protein [Streptomyces sp. XD-27]WKX71287.1 acyl-CoA-binding protein [Streptomyces sp. XD-27]